MQHVDDRGADWDTRTVHDDPLAAWAEATAGELEPRPEAGDGGPPLAQEGNGRGGSIRSDDSSVRESARRKLREAFEGVNPQLRAALADLAEVLCEDGDS